MNQQIHLNDEEEAELDKLMKQVACSVNDFMDGLPDVDIDDVFVDMAHSVCQMGWSPAVVAAFKQQEGL